MDAQCEVAAFTEEYGFEDDAAYQVLALASEVGEMAGDVTHSTNWGATPGDVRIERDEVGDALFCLLQVANSLDVDAETALHEAMEKYRRRIEDPDSPYTGAQYDGDLE